MNLRIYLGLVVFAFIITSCGAPKVVVKTGKDNAIAATAEGDFSQATEAWKQYFKQTPVEATAGSDYAEAAKTAFKSGNSELAVSWFDQARYKNYADADMYLTLSKIFQSQKNISKELSALEYVTENYPEKSSEIDNRLFDIYNEINLTNEALQAWNRLDSASKSELKNLESYFEIQKSLKDSIVCDSVSGVILELDSKNIAALEWNAKKYYWLGENHFIQEMAKYEKKKTNKQYRILLKELEIATADFKKALVYFEKLWEQKPGKEYASYFASIYARFGDEKKSNSYQKYMK